MKKIIMMMVFIAAADPALAGGGPLSDLAATAAGLRLRFATEGAGVPAVNGPREIRPASIVPPWFRVSGLSFVMIRKGGGGDFVAILRSGVFSTLEMGIYTSGQATASVDFTEYASNPMAAPKNKAEAGLDTAAKRREVAAILREAQKYKPLQGAQLATLAELISLLE